MITTYRRIYGLLDQQERLRFFQLLAMMIVMGILDMIGVAAILPFLAVVADPTQITENRFLAFLNQFTGFAEPKEFLVFLGASVFALLVLSLGFKTLTLYAMARFSQMRNHSISTRLLHRYLNQPYTWFLGRHSSELGKQVLSEVQNLINGTLMPAMRLLAHAISLLCLIALLVAVDPIVALVAAGLLTAAYAGIFLMVRRYLMRMGKVRLSANRARFQIAQEVMGGIKEVKILGMEEAYLARFKVPSREMAISSTGVQIVGELPRHLLEAVAFGGVISLVIVLLLREGSDLAAVLPVLGVFAFAGLRMFPSVQQIYHSLIQLRSSAPVLKAIHRDMHEVSPMHRPTREAAGRMRLDHDLSLDDVLYSYPSAERPSLKGLTLTIEARTTVGIVGGTGAGKTTAVDIILGLLEPQRGSIRVDGESIGPNNLRSWQNILGYVPQQIFLTDDTVAANIAFGIAPDLIDMAAVERAARVANLHEFVIKELPQAYQTFVGERGVRLSGGQRQRIGIARALYHDPDVLILDEATSALDNLTEKAVIDAVHNLAQEKTVIMIAHRLTTVRDCDTIFLLENGQLVAKGSYQELMANSEEFQRLVFSSEREK